MLPVPLLAPELVSPKARREPGFAPRLIAPTPATSPPIEARLSPPPLEPLSPVITPAQRIPTLHWSLSLSPAPAPYAAPSLASWDVAPAAFGATPPRGTGTTGAWLTPAHSGAWPPLQPAWTGRPIGQELPPPRGLPTLSLQLPDVSSPTTQQAASPTRPEPRVKTETTTTTYVV